MADKTTVTTRGHTEIRARIRRETGVQPGTELMWQVMGPDEWRVTIVREQVTAPEARAMRGFSRRFRATGRTADWMRELRPGET
jgi:hypothetical protein